MNLLRHIILCILYIGVVAYCLPVLARQDSNPLLGMVGKVYSDYFDEYERVCDTLFAGDSLSLVPSWSGFSRKLPQPILPEHGNLTGAG